MTAISSKNATYQKFEVLKTNRKKRHRYQEFIIEGVRNINEAVRNNWQISSFLYAQERPLSGWANDLLSTTQTQVNYALIPRLMDELSSKTDTSELMAIVHMNRPLHKIISKNPVIALFDRPSNKGNLGTMLRSCDALGVDQLILTGHSVDIYDPEVISSSMGSFFSVPFKIIASNKAVDSYIAELKKLWPSLKVIGTTEQAKAAIYEVDMTTPVLLLLGNEKDGLSRRLEDICDIQAMIPMHKDSSASSFNVSCAATAVFYEVNRQRDNLKMQGKL